ncbi:MAG: LD-carboxypeptidase [Deltaproteobacteria bacterium]|nr:LD-carboxypeptidase [Deltaproteobacteria bacterium]
MIGATPLPLNRDDRVRVVAPAGPVPENELRAGVKLLAQRYRVDLEPGLVAASGFLAGSDERRAGELQAALDDPDCAAVIAARGGYGTTRIIDRLRFGGLLDRPRWVVGSSDLTALLIQLWAEIGLHSIHGPMVAGLVGSDDEDRQALFDLLEGRPWSPPDRLVPLIDGTARGPLIGGNLMILAHLCGALDPSFAEGAILFVEDIGEQPYRIDRCLVQLERTGVLGRVAGCLIGEFTQCDPGRCGVTAAEVLLDRLGRLGVPVAAGYPAAHGGRNLPFVHGDAVELGVSEGSATVTALTR